MAELYQKLGYTWVKAWYHTYGDARDWEGLKQHIMEHMALKIPAKGKPEEVSATNAEKDTV